MAAKKANFDPVELIKPNLIADLLKETPESKEQIAQEIDQAIQRVPYDLLDPHQNNAYDLCDIEELADNIEAFGLMDPLLVKPEENGRFLIIGGHRRYLAIKMLVETRGLDDFRLVLCHICSTEESKIVERLRLHSTNFTSRNMTEYNRMVQIADLTTIIKEARDEGKFLFKGKMRDIIANYTHLGKTQTQKYMTIWNSGTDEIKDKLKKEEITVEQAYEETQLLASPTDSIKQSDIEATRPTRQYTDSYRRFADELCHVFGTKVSIRGEKKGTISIAYNSTYELDRLLLMLRNTEEANTHSVNTNASL